MSEFYGEWSGDEEVKQESNIKIKKVKNTKTKAELNK